MKKYLKPVLIGLAVIFLLAQFIRPARNTSNNDQNHISTRYPIPADVEASLKTACYDCHSNSTVYPWYSNIQPVAWWLADHVNDGKRHFNFSELAARPVALQYHKLEELIEEVKEGEMPLSSYTIIHRDAILSDAQKDALMNWAQSVRDSMKANYPADSLVLKRKPAAPGK